MTLLVMLPAAHAEPGDFAQQGFLDALPPGVEALPAPLRPADYLEEDLAGRLHAEVIAPALRRGPRPVWLLGISLGGMGALLYARTRPVAGLILLAPFLATRGTIAEVTEAGGLDAWNPGPLAPHDLERGLLAWLRGADLAGMGVRLGYGSADRYVAASAMLARRLPPERVTIAEGGHDWPTWVTLWRRILATRPLVQSATGL